MAKLYQVIRKFHGVGVGEIVEVEGTPHRAIAANLRLAPKGVEAATAKGPEASEAEATATALPTPGGLPAPGKGGGKS